MAAFVQFLLAVLLLGLINKGLCQCSLKNITVGTERTWKEVQGKAEWKVSFINECNCPQEGLVVNCDGFQTTEPVNPDLFVKSGNTCLVNRGRAIPPRSSVSFFYAWDPPFIFMPVTSRTLC